MQTRVSRVFSPNSNSSFKVLKLEFTFEQDNEFDFTENEINNIKKLCDALRPIEYAVKMLCKESANLISAENALTFVNDELAKLDTPIANALKERFEESFKGEIMY